MAGYKLSQPIAFVPRATFHPVGLLPTIEHYISHAHFRFVIFTGVGFVNFKKDRQFQVSSRIPAPSRRSFFPN